MRWFLASVSSFFSQDSKPALRENRVARILNVPTLGGPTCHFLGWESALLFDLFADSGGPSKYPFGALAILRVSDRSCFKE